MNENNLIKPIDSVEKISRDKHEKEEYVMNNEDMTDHGFDALLKYEQVRLKEIERILKNKKSYKMTINEIYEKEKNNIEEIRSSHINGK